MKETNEKKVCSCLIKIYFRLTLNLNAFELFVLVISLTTKLFLFCFFLLLKAEKALRMKCDLFCSQWIQLFLFILHSSFFVVVHHSQFNWLSWLRELKTLLMSWRCHSKVKDCKQCFTLAKIYYMLCLVVCNIYVFKYKHNFWTDHHHQNIGFQIETEYMKLNWTELNWTELSLTKPTGCLLTVNCSLKSQTFDFFSFVYFTQLKLFFFHSSYFPFV